MEPRLMTHLNPKIRTCSLKTTATRDPVIDAGLIWRRANDARRPITTGAFQYSRPPRGKHYTRVRCFRYNIHACVRGCSHVREFERSVALPPDCDASAQCRCVIDSRRIERRVVRLDLAVHEFRRRMKYSPQQQQQQQKERKSESEMSSVNATPSRAASALQRSASAASQSSAAARRALTCRPLSTDMFAWMRVFRLANLLHQVGC
ncbi:uncharacterized protein LOC100677839 isoform X1 [Nasonia vitripennis]|uniref:Uncharacterized protein n=1 Tax=Nasonia vitripennis TaxID=7425 RepID=A0A7M7T748_NASVI|nr:uncharacterized protein LOC100677839 isoform X1 [Nasonia vitripennis]